MRAAFLGATKGMGRALARLMAERGDALFLLGRDVEDLRRSASDLQARGAHGAVGVAECDLARPETFALSLAAADEALGGMDAVIVTAAAFATQEALEADLSTTQRMLEVNFVHTVLFCEQAKNILLENGGGSLCVFSSVAGERGRKPVILYGAAKAGLTHYLEGLDHKFASSGLRVTTVKPGFVHTSMTAGLAPPPFAGHPAPVARRVLRAIDRGWPVVYAPAMWRAIMAIVRRLPRWMMRRVGF